MYLGKIFPREDKPQFAKRTTKKKLRVVFAVGSVTSSPFLQVGSPYRPFSLNYAHFKKLAFPLVATN